MCKTGWASNPHLPSQVTFSSTFPKHLFQHKAVRRLQKERPGRARLYILNLTPFFASPTKADKNFLQPPNLGRGVLTWKGDGLWLCLTLVPWLHKAR